MSVGEVVRYRIGQVVAALHASVDPADLAVLADHLTPAERDLFMAMLPSDQRHSLDLYRRLIEAGCGDLDLLRAALLHDVGKARARLRVWHRSAIVLGGRFCPRAFGLLVARGPRWFSGPLDVALRHAELGAESAQRAGSPARVVQLIRNHAGNQGTGSCPEEPDELLDALRRFDSLV